MEILPVDMTLDIIKAYGPSGLIAVLMWVMLQKSEVRETKKDTRIQLLENQLRESYDERIAAADQLAEALYGNAKAIDNLTNEIRSNGNAKHH